MLLGVGCLVGVLGTVVSVGTDLQQTALGALVTLTALAAVAVGTTRLARSRPSWLAVLVVAVLTRLPYVTLSPIHDDSQFYYRNAVTLIDGLAAGSVPLDALSVRYLGVHAVMGGFVPLFDGAGANVASFVAALCTVPILGATAASLFGSRRVGVATGFVVAVFPIHVYYSWWAYSEPVTLCFFSLALYGFITRRYGVATVATVPVLFMRIEYVLFVLLPLFAFTTVRETRLYGAMFVSPLLPLGVGLFAPTRVERFIESFTGVSPSFLKIQVLRSTLLSSEPIGHVLTNASFYAPHFLHWGVPYWDIGVVNPLLTVAFTLGIIRVSARNRATGVILALVLGIVIGGVLVRELFGVEKMYGALVLVGVLCALALVLATESWRDPLMIPLLSTGPYLVLITILYSGPRYVLPVACVFLLYAGYGLCWSTDWLRDKGTVTASYPIWAMWTRRQVNDETQGHE